MRNPRRKRAIGRRRKGVAGEKAGEVKSPRGEGMKEGTQREK